MDPVTFLEELLSIPSVSGEEAALAEFLVERMTDLGFRAHRDRVGNVVGLLGNADVEREIALVGHVDTVRGAVPVERRQGLLYGRGAVDAKGPLVTFVLAAARVADRLKGVRLRVVGTVGEEAEGSGARYLARTVKPPWCAMIGEPSGWDGVTIGYKGMLSLRYWRTQPSGHDAGERPRPAEEAVDFWNKLTSYTEAHNAGKPGRFDTLDPSLQELRTFSDGLEDGVLMNVGVRIPQGCRMSSLKHEMEAWLDDGHLVFRSSDPPVSAAKNTSVVRALLGAIRAEGGKPRFKVKTGTSDMNIVGPAWGCPIVAYGPGDSALDHTPDEHVEIKELLRGIDVLVRALETLGKL